MNIQNKLVPKIVFPNYSCLYIYIFITARDNERGN